MNSGSTHFQDAGKDQVFRLHSNVALGAEALEGFVDLSASTDIALQTPSELEKIFVSMMEKNQEKQQRVIELGIAQVLPTENQPRQTFDDLSLQELAQSIKNFGILNPLIVTETDDGRYRIVAGERRWRAAQMAGLLTIPCLVRNYAEQQALEISIIENIQREDLNPVDEARSFQRLIDEHDYTQDMVANRMGKDRSTVSNTLRLLTLPALILDDLQQKKLSVGHAKALCAVDDPKRQLRIHKLIMSKKLSVRQTEEFVKNLRKDSSEQTKVLIDRLPADLRHMCDEFKGHLGTKVRITGSPDNGKIEISYYSMEDLERIADLVLGLSGRREISPQTPR